MQGLREVCATGILVLASGISFGQGPVSNDPSQEVEVIKELVTHLPKGVKTGKQLPTFVRKAVKEMVSFSSNKVEVEALCARLVVITDMDGYLNYMNVKDPKMRGLIKKRHTAFTINKRWPIYVNGESDLYKIASEIEQKSAENSVIHKLAAVLWHEMVHAQGQPDEAVAIAEEIKMLERLHWRGLVELDWVGARRAQLAHIRRGQFSGGPLNVKTIDP